MKLLRDFTEEIICATAEMSIIAFLRVISRMGLLEVGIGQSLNGVVW
jgi:hypothetical protein